MPANVSDRPRAIVTAGLANLVEAASIHTLSVFENLLTHQLLGQRLEAVAEQLRAACQGLANGMVVLQTCDGLGHLALHGFQGCVPLVLALIKFAEDSPYPDPEAILDDVYA